MPCTVIVCGGRDYANKAAVYKALDALAAKHGEIFIVHGAARGADTLAAHWAKDRKQQVRAYPADWEREGHKAGVYRNRKMLREHLTELAGVVAFPGGNGTAHMTWLATEHGYKVWRPYG